MRHVLMLIIMFLALCLAGNVWAQDEPGAGLETATGPEGLLELEQKGEITIRALRGWGKLPEQFVTLAQEMRQAGSFDLLGADLQQIKLWLEQGESGDSSLAPFQDQLQALAVFLEAGDHLEWTPVADGDAVSAGTLLRSGSTRWTQTMDGPVKTSMKAADTEAAQAEDPIPAQEEIASLPEEAQDEPEQTEQPAISDTARTSQPSQGQGPSDGVELPINDQLEGTYKVKLRVEGLTPIQADDEPFLKRKLQTMLPDNNPQIIEAEREFLERSSRYFTVRAALEDDLPYNLFLGLAKPDTPVTISVDAPDDFEIPVSETDANAGVFYTVVEKSFYVYRHDLAKGDAEINFEEGRDGTISWTPRLEANGRPTGPRVLGIYMAYRITKNVRDHEMGTLNTRHQRIGWVVVAMPGDVYEFEGNLYAVGQEQSLTTQEASLPPAPEVFDFELPQYALDNRAIAVSEDLRHVTWIEGEKEGQKRMVTNGVPGKWYDDIKEYPMGFSANGETLCYEAHLGDKVIPVCNGADGQPFDELEFIKMSPDGAHILTGGRIGRINQVYLDGKLIRETPVKLHKAAMAANGKAAWTEWDMGGRLTGEEFQMMVTSDGLEGEKFSAIYEMCFAKEIRDDLYYIAAKKGENRYLMRNTEQLKPDMGSAYQFTLTDDGTSYAYVSPDGDKSRMVVKGDIGPEFDSIWDPATFSPDGQRHMYEAKNDNQALLVIDGEIFAHDFGPLKSVTSPIFSPDSHHWAAGFRLNDQEYVVVKDGLEVGRGQGQPWRIVFSPDGQSLAWIEDLKHSGRVVLNGQPGPEFEDIFDERPPQFSPDSKHLVYFALDDDKKMRLVVFGNQERIHDNINPLAIFLEDQVQYLAVDGNRSKRKSIPLN